MSVSSRSSLMVTALMLVGLPVLVLAQATPAPQDPPESEMRQNSYLDSIKESGGVEVASHDDGVIVRRKPRTTYPISARIGFALPATLTLKVKSAGAGIELYAANHAFTFNDPKDPDTLLFRRPNGEREPNEPYVNKLKDRGRLPMNKWVTIVVRVDEQSLTVTVDGEERLRSPITAASSNTSFSFLPTDAGELLVGGFDVRRRSPSAARGANPPPGTTTVQPSTPPKAPPQQDGVTIDIPTTPAQSANSTPPAAGATPIDPNAIDRPAFRNKPKSLDRSVTAVTGMYVRIGDDGDQMGLTGDIIATVDGQSRGGGTASVGFYRKDGDEHMKTAFEEAARAVRMRYPYWQPGRIDISFGDKFTSHGGASAGTAFALLMLSTLEGFEIDPKCAVTGDITVDWRVRKVGGVTAKLRGATLDKCQLACIPTENEQAFIDMALLHGTSSLYEIQVFSMDTLQQAIAVARKDRASDTAEAIRLFGELQARLARNEKDALKAPETVAALQQIVKLAPNHLSAKAMLAIADGKASKSLSANATLYRLSVLFYPYRVLLAANKPLSRDNLPTHVTQNARKRINELRPIAPKSFVPAINDVAALIDAMDRAAANPNGSAKSIDTRVKAVNARFAELFGDAAFVEKLVREGY